MTQTEILSKLNYILEKDQDNMNPKTLYTNIYNSTGDEYMLSKIFNIEPTLIKEIKLNGCLNEK